MASFRRKPIAALAAVSAAAALAVPAASANAETPPPTTFTPPTFVCETLTEDIQLALDAGDQLAADLISDTFDAIGCGDTAT
jgi:hypothetical protein